MDDVWEDCLLVVFFKGFLVVILSLIFWRDIWVVDCLFLLFLFWLLVLLLVYRVLFFIDLSLVFGVYFFIVVCFDSFFGFFFMVWFVFGLIFCDCEFLLLFGLFFLFDFFMFCEFFIWCNRNFSYFMK